MRYWSKPSANFVDPEHALARRSRDTVVELVLSKISKLMEELGSVLPSEIEVACMAMEEGKTKIHDLIVGSRSFSLYRFVHEEPILLQAPNR